MDSEEPADRSGALRRIFHRLLTPRRVSIAIDDLPALGERGAAIRAHVLGAWWLSPVRVEFRNDDIVAFGLWYPKGSGQRHPETPSHPAN